MKNLGHIPNEFILGENKMFKSSDLMNIMEKPMIIGFHNEKTLKDYLNEIKEFVDTNKNNNINYKRNHKRILLNCLNALKKLHTLGFCYTKLDMSHFTLESIYTGLCYEIYCKNCLKNIGFIHKDNNNFKYLLLKDKFC